MSNALKSKVFILDVPIYLPNTRTVLRVVVVRAYLKRKIELSLLKYLSNYTISIYMSMFSLLITVNFIFPKI